MMRTRLAALLLTLAPVALLAASPARAIEVAAYTPDSTLLPARQATPAPLRIAEALSLEPFARLAPAAVGARAELDALEAWNRNRQPRRPTQVGFARDLAVPLRMSVEPSTWPGRLGYRVGDGFLSRERKGNFVWGTSAAVDDAGALRLELAEVNLPEGTRFWVYSMGGEARSFDLRLLRGDGTIVSPVIAGDRIYLEVELPADRLTEAQGFTIRRLHETVPSAAFSTTVPLKKSGFTSPQKRTAFSNMKSRKSSSVMSPCSTISYASGTTPAMSGTSKCPMSEL